jgi:hypothetical protein
MTLCFWKNGVWKSVALVVAASLALTLLPAQGRCDENSCSLFYFLIKVAKVEKPDVPKPTCSAPHCPLGVCTGAAMMPCCPSAAVMPCCPGAAMMPCCPMTVIHRATAPTVCREGRCQTDACPACKPDCCANACSNAERTAAELRALCAEQTRLLHEMRQTMAELRSEINALRNDLQSTRQAPQQIYVPVPVPNPNPMPMPNPGQNTWPTPHGYPPMPHSMPVTPTGGHVKVPVQYDSLQYIYWE